MGSFRSLQAASLGLDTSERLGVILVGLESGGPSLQKPGTALPGCCGPGEGGGKAIPGPDFEPQRLESGDIKGNKEIRGEAGWDCL